METEQQRHNGRDRLAIPSVCRRLQLRKEIVVEFIATNVGNFTKCLLQHVTTITQSGFVVLLLQGIQLGADALETQRGDVRQ